MNREFKAMVMAIFVILITVTGSAVAQASYCPPLGSGAVRIVLEIKNDPLSPYIAEVRGEIPQWSDPALYVVVPESESEPPRYWLNPQGFLYQFSRIDATGWGYTLIQGDPYVVQPREPNYSNWYQFHSMDAVESFKSISLTTAYQSWWSDPALDAPVSDDIIAHWYVYDAEGELIEYSQVWGSDDGTLLYPARWTAASLSEPSQSEQEGRHPACWDSMEAESLDEFKQLVLLQREAWAER